MKGKFTTKSLVYGAFFTALVYIFSRFFQIPIVTPFGQTRFHLGNVFCLLAGITLGKGLGGLSAGLGSAIFDLLDPVYFTAAPITFITKFAMAFVAGLIFERGSFSKKRLVIANILGQITYVFLYLLQTYIKNRFVMDFTSQAILAELIPKAGVSLFNALISVIIASILALPLLKRINFE
ncbi:MAG: ECF transporter S component [Anaerococcus sp.]|nr:ECF transporter S component [Anaerococcus sp.]